MLKLFHGSRHDLKDGFSLDRVGSGFGSAGARGVGVYLSEARQVADKYRSAGAGGILLDGKPLDENPLFTKIEPPHLRGEVENLLRTFSRQTDSLRSVRSVVKQKTLTTDPQLAPEAKQWTQVQALLKKAKTVSASNGHIYTVAADVKAADLLDWELPLSKQSPKVQAALKRSGIDVEAKAYRGGDPTGFDIMTALKRRCGETYWGPDYGRHTSEALLAAGIPGCRHDDYDLRKEGIIKSNYVIWDLSKLNVIAKDGLPLTDEGKRKNPPLFHGTPYGPLTALKEGRAGLIFTSESKDYAALYGKTILQVEVDLRNPADLDRDPKARAIAIANFNECSFRNTDDGFSAKFNPKKDETWELAESPTFKEAMEDAGYDGAIFKEDDGGRISGRSFVAFYEQQVKVLPVKQLSDPEASLGIPAMTPPSVAPSVGKSMVAAPVPGE